jgi:hypothetical protein
MMRIRSRIAVLVAVSTVLLAACGSAAGPSSPTGAPGGGSADAGSGDGTVALTGYARPAAIDDLATVELVAPPEINAGRAPVFEWKPVAGAATYRLAVLAPDGPTWSWHGDATSIRYGGVEEGVNGPSLYAGSHWSVAGLAADGSLLALSALRPVSPESDRGSAPSWTAVSPATPAPVATDAPTEITACDLLTPGELEDLFGREFKAAQPDDVHYISSCDFDLADGRPGVDVTMNPRDMYNAEDWAGPDYEQVDGLGEDSFAVNAGILTVTGFIRGDKSVRLTLGFGKRALLEKLVEAARLADARLMPAD